MRPLLVAKGLTGSGVILQEDGSVSVTEPSVIMTGTPEGQENVRCAPNLTDCQQNVLLNGTENTGFPGNRQRNGTHKREQ